MTHAADKTSVTLPHPASERERRGDDAEPVEPRSRFAVIKLCHLRDWSILVE
jgi:hypothetical protein